MDSNQSLREMILLVDDDPLVLQMMNELVQPLGIHIIHASDLKTAKKAVAENISIGVVICDHFLPDGNGLNFMQELKSSRPMIVRILITGYPDPKIALDAINHGEIYRFITKPCSPDTVTVAARDGLERFRLVRENKRLQEAMLASNEQLQKANQLLHESLSDSVKLCLGIIDRFDHLLASHCERVAKWSVEIGKSFDLSLEEIDTLHLSAQMHDIGLISVSPSYHSQQQTGWADAPPLQQAALQMHPKIGADLVKHLHQKRVPEIVAAHHEWYNGGGYPQKLAKESIPFLAAILAVPDAYDEWPGERSEAAKFVEENLGVRFHPEVGRAFLRLLSTAPDFAQKDREVLIAELQPEMKLTCDVLSASGIVLATKGQTLIPKLIQYIHQHDQSEPLTQRIFVANEK
jgi:response regulator RpfG family c-di-GMP phosphodiesterase